MQGMLRCGSLSHVDDDGPRPKPARASPTGGEPNFINRRLRKIRGKRDKDPLSLVGSDIDVEYPLAALERRQCASSSRHCNSPRCRKDASHEEDDERLRRLQNMIYHRGDHALSEGTVASVRKRGLDEIGSTLVSTTSSLSNDTPHKAEEVGQRVIRKIHGKGVPVPLCPTCSGELTYLYISRRNQAIRACEIQNEDESTKEKLQNLLPPLCEQCRAHVLHEHSRCKQLMLENFNDWLESELDDGDGVKQSAVGPGDDPIISYHPLNAKLRVVNASPANRSDEQDQGVHVATSFASSQMEEPTPRLSNRSDRSESPSFGFVDGEVRTQDRPIFDSLSSSMSGGNRAYRRKGQISYDEKEKPNSDEEDDTQPGGRYEATVVDNIPAESIHTRRQGVSPDYFSDDDPFSSLDEAVTEEDDDKTVFGAESTVSGGSVCNGGLINEQRDDQLVKIAEIIANQSTGSIQIIRTESEELAILEQHSMKKEIATTQIAEGLVKGHELTPSQCDRCRMPMMKNADDDEECVTCPIIERKAKRIAKQKRKALVAKYVNAGKQDRRGDGSVQKEGPLEHEAVVVEDVDSDSDSEAQISSVAEQHGTEETEDMNALEEGLAGSNSCGDTLDVSIIDGQPSLQQHSVSLSVDMNPYGGQSSDGCDYWVRHSSSQLQAARNTQTSQRSVVSDEGRRQCPSQDSQYQRSVSEVSEARLSSAVSSNSRQHNFSFSSDTIKKHQQQMAPEADQHLLYQSHSNPHLGSTSGISIHHGSSDVSSAHQASLSDDAIQQTHIYHSNRSSSEVSDCHPGDDHQPHGHNSSSSEVSECHTASDESSTRCPRNFPSGEMIWNHGPHNCASEPPRLYPVPSCAVESRTASLDEPELGPSSTGQSHASDPDGEGNQDSNVDLAPSESGCHAEKIALSNDEPNLQSLVESPMPLTEQGPTNDQTTNDSFPGAGINSLSARIARLADALKEVAEQLPREEIEARSRIDQVVTKQEICQTVDMRNNSSRGPENACTTPIRVINASNEAVHDPHTQRCQQWNPAQDPNEIAFQKGAKFRPIPSPLVVEHESWRGRIQSTTQRKMLEEDAYSEPDTENDQIAFWKHARDDTNPMQGSNIIGVPISPINIGARRHQIDLFGGGGAEQKRSSKERMASPFSRQKVSSPRYNRPSPKHRHRADPPGRRVDMWALDSRDPTGELARSRPSDDIRCHLSTTSRYEGTQARDCPPEQLVKMTTSHRNSVTPKTRGCRPWVDKTPETEQRRCCPSIAHSSGVGPSSSGGGKLETRLVSAKPLPQDSVQLDTPWEDANVGAPLQTSNSFGDSSLCQLFKQIDEIEDDFHTIVASLPGSEGQTISTKSSTGEDESPKSSYEKHSLVEVHLNNAGSFESNASEDTMVTDVVQRMRRIKDYIERVDSGDDGEGSRCSYQSSGEMTELLKKLEQAAESLRALDSDWED